MHTADTDLPIYKHLPLETRRKLGLGVDKLIVLEKVAQYATSSARICLKLSQ